MIIKSTKVTCLLLMLSILAACGQSEATTIEEEPAAAEVAGEVAVAEAAATDTSQPPTETAVPPTETAEPTATVAFTPTPEAVAGTCLDCHSDKDMLIEVAEPVEETESSESSGVG